MTADEKKLADALIKEASTLQVHQRGDVLNQYSSLISAAATRHAMERPRNRDASLTATGIVALPVPSIGRTVIYTLSAQDAEEINRRRTTGPDIAGRIKEEKWPLGAQAHIGNSVAEGNEFPAVVVRTWDGDVVNLRVILDGSDDYWATSRSRHDDDGEAGKWHWPPRV